MLSSTGEPESGGGAMCSLFSDIQTCMPLRRARSVMNSQSVWLSCSTYLCVVAVLVTSADSPFDRAISATMALSFFSRNTTDLRPRCRRWDLS